MLGKRKNAQFDGVVDILEFQRENELKICRLIIVIIA